MELEGTVTLTVHGLQADNDFVRAEVFLEKFRALLKSLKISDSAVNGKKSHDIIITGLQIGSAEATIREKISVRKSLQIRFATPYFSQALNAVYNGDRYLDRYPKDLIKSFEPLAKIDKRFSHGEIAFGDGKVIRIDEYLSKQTSRALKRFETGDETVERYFEGISFGMFDGVLKEIDSRGILVRGTLILTAGGKEIECLFKREDIPKLRENFERRARVEAKAHYDGENLLPVRLDVKRIEPIIDAPDVGRWRGVFTGRRVAKPEGI